MALGRLGQADLLGGIGVGQGDGKHTGILLCSKVPVEVGQPGQSCDTRTAIRGAQATAAFSKVRVATHSQLNITFEI